MQFRFHLYSRPLRENIFREVGRRRRLGAHLLYRVQVRRNATYMRSELYTLLHVHRLVVGPAQHIRDDIISQSCALALSRKFSRQLGAIFGTRGVAIKYLYTIIINIIIDTNVLFI